MPRSASSGVRLAVCGISTSLSSVVEEDEAIVVSIVLSVVDEELVFSDAVVSTVVFIGVVLTVVVVVSMTGACVVTVVVTGVEVVTSVVWVVVVLGHSYASMVSSGVTTLYSATVGSLRYATTGSLERRASWRARDSSYTKSWPPVTGLVENQVRRTRGRFVSAGK